MDETNFNLYTIRQYGRSKKGQSCSVIAASIKGANLHLIECISDTIQFAKAPSITIWQTIMEIFEDRLFLWSTTLHATPDLKK